MAHPDYVYLGDRWTRPELRGATCRAVRRADGRCIRGRNGSMLVQIVTSDGTPGPTHVVVGRRLRRLPVSPSP